MAKAKNILIIESDPGDGMKAIYEARTTKDQTNNTRMELRYSKLDSCWAGHIVNKAAAKLHDYGDGVKFEFMNGDKVDFDYGQIAELHAFLEYYESHHGRFKTRLKVYKEAKE